MVKMEIQNDVSAMIDAASPSLCVGYTGLSSPDCLLLRYFMDLILLLVLHLGLYQ